MRSKTNAIGVCAAFVFVGLAFAAIRAFVRPSVPPRPRASISPEPLVEEAERARFVGSEACSRCHPGEATAHARTFHARTLRTVGREEAGYFKTAQRLRDRAIPAEYTFAVRGATPSLRVKEPGSPPQEVRPEWLVGSGHHGSAFLARQSEGLLELRVSYYPPVREWRWTAAQEEELPGRPAAGRPLAGERARQCFLCHSTAVVVEGGHPDPDRSLLGIGCERCHGPGRAHAEGMAAGKRSADIYRLTGLQASEVMSLCGQCHRSPSGDPGSAAAGSPGIARFAATALAMSRCYLESKGGLSCLSCHNPHTPVSHDTAGYERVCLSCHSRGSADHAAAAGVPCPVNPRTGCVSCHMPSEPFEFPLTLHFHNHWIRRRRG